MEIDDLSHERFLPGNQHRGTQLGFAVSPHPPQSSSQPHLGFVLWLNVVISFESCQRVIRNLLFFLSSLIMKGRAVPADRWSKNVLG